MQNIEFFETLATLLGELDGFAEQPWQQPNWQDATVAKALRDVWYLDGQDGRETRCYYGVVPTTDELAIQVNRINELKLSIKTQLATFKNNDWQADFMQRLPELNISLAAHQLGRLHLKQLWRQLPVFEKPINTLRYSWYQSGRSIKRLSVVDVAKILEKHNQALDHIQVYWDKLNRLPEDEPLAQVQAQAPVLRANLWFADGERKAFNAPMPVFAMHPPEKISFPEPYTPGQRKRAQRSDVSIDPNPYLPALRIHRYL
ncbi:DNA replication terminus site-binding protein [Salinibius halmophilus]|uniref:DNA replication terminus site-binding protein n=1 Tax=Salinibius halmophilus TaxID=1853216 RepID=UPI000E66B8CE|nr:DNA replication terminus site-binding protein [Salinibius halmophilus]